VQLLFSLVLYAFGELVVVNLPADDGVAVVGSLLQAAIFLDELLFPLIEEVGVGVLMLPSHCEEGSFSAASKQRPWLLQIPL
jgi:hypothetical protein